MAQLRHKPGYDVLLVRYITLGQKCTQGGPPASVDMVIQSADCREFGPESVIAPIIFVPSAVSRVQDLEEAGVVDMKLIWTNTNYGP